MVECPKCGEEYTNVANHWYYSPDHRPKLTQKQLEIATGLLMGDGSISKKKENCYLRANMINEKYLQYIDNVFGCLGSGVELNKTSQEAAERNKSREFFDTVNEDEYSDSYRWYTRCHPKFNEFRRWYSSGEKVWPENIKLTPTVLKHWYVSDGHYNTQNGEGHIEISIDNEKENKNKVSNYFINSDIPKPSNYSEYENKLSISCKAYWTQKQSQILFNYMGKPLPDFEYKWPEEHR